MRSLYRLAILAFAALPLTLAAKVEVYKIDPVHSGVTFKIRHFLNKVPGNFGQFSGEIHLDRENMENSKAVATIQVATVDTNNDDRDAHLQNEDFFQSDTYPEITFTSTKWKKVSEENYHIHGDLDIVGKTIPVVLDAELLGFGEGRRGTQLVGWVATTTLNREDFDMTYGAPAVGDEVEVELNIQGHLQE